METQLIRRPAASCCSLLSSSSRLVAPRINTSAVTGIRQKSSRRRLKHALNIPPAPSFLNDSSSSNHIVFNPPPTEASVYHTPFKFLPQSDPRRRQNLSVLFASQQGAVSPIDASKLPQVQKWKFPTKPHHLTPTDVEEIRRLRTEDPATNSVCKLAAKYKCSTLFIRMCVQAPREYKAKLKEEEEALKSRWGPIRAAARAERRRRLDMLLRGEL